MILISRFKKIKLRRSQKIWLIVSLLVGLLIVVIVRELTAPVHGHTVPVDTKVKVTHHQPQKIIPAQSLTNTYFDLALPPGFSVQATTGGNSGLLYSQTITKNSIDGSLIIAIGIKPSPSGGLSGDSSYSFRAGQPDNYQITPATFGGESVSIAANTSEDGVVAFWLHDGYLATISVSSGLANSGGEIPSEQAALKTLLTAWQWL